MFSNDNGIVVAPQHEAVFIDMFKNIFIGGNIKIRICGLMINAKHTILFANLGNRGHSFFG
jgi:hypothetical protein